MVGEFGESGGLDLGSDHRCVQMVMRLRALKRSKRFSMRQGAGSVGWEPGDARRYKELLDGRLMPTCPSVCGRVKARPTKVFNNCLAMLSKSFFEISNGHNWGAIWSNRDENLSHDTAIASFCSGEGFQGAWGLGRWKKVENCFIFGPLFF